ncbi:hypothetical protein C2E23DRAFT_853340 [Lenzites betulinus]|nr:hypothetical protein C2E23DRAFT_853340 [Lenzites betulinus]
MVDLRRSVQRSESPAGDQDAEQPRQRERTPTPLPADQVPNAPETEEEDEDGDRREAPPDFAGPAFEVAREALMEGGIVDSDEQAVDHLLARWTEKSQTRVGREGMGARKAGARRGREAKRVRVPSPASSTLSATSLPKKPAPAKAKARTLPPIPRGKPPPEEFLKPVAEFALSRLRDKKYVELFYFTEEGMRLAAGDNTPSQDDALTVANRDATIVLTTAPRPPKGVKGDDMLTWDQVSKARTLLLLHAKNEGWEEEHLEVLAFFFFSIDAHPIRSEPRGNETAVRYQALYRREWHNAMTREEPFDLAVINEAAMLRIQTQLLSEQTMRALQVVRANRDRTWSRS